MLGPMLEEYFGHALLISRGGFATFFTHPISGTIFTFIGLFLLCNLVTFFAASRGKSTLMHRSTAVALDAPAEKDDP